MLLSSGLNFEGKVLEQVSRCNNGKGIKQERGRPHCLGIFRERVAYDIYVAAHQTLTSKVIRTIDID